MTKEKYRNSSYTDWSEVQADTFRYLNQGLKSENDLDFIIANVLHRTGFQMVEVKLHSSTTYWDSFLVSFLVLMSITSMFGDGVLISGVDGSVTSTIKRNNIQGYENYFECISKKSIITLDLNSILDL
ncbi:hypothetical protein K501DRAFT_331047 [Backusella circina FSU 941]|nr:hypothetical protein K501DRAFT_331047 [Backusella circina FSU 941]